MTDEPFQPEIEPDPNVDLLVELQRSVTAARDQLRSHLAEALDLPAELLRSSHDDGCDCHPGPTLAERESGDDPGRCRSCGKSAGACGRSASFCCEACAGEPGVAGTSFLTHRPVVATEGPTGSDDLPGMWEASDLSAGWADVSDTSSEKGVDR